MRLLLHLQGLLREAASSNASLPESPTSIDFPSSLLEILNAQVDTAAACGTLFSRTALQSGATHETETPCEREDASIAQPNSCVDAGNPSYISFLLEEPPASPKQQQAPQLEGLSGLDIEYAIAALYDDITTEDDNTRAASDSDQALNDRIFVTANDSMGRSDARAGTKEIELFCEEVLL